MGEPEANGGTRILADGGVKDRPHDPFPRDAARALARHLPAYARLAFRLARDRQLSKARRAAVVAAAGYLVSPVDAIPGLIPVLGQLDDLLVGMAAIRFALAGLRPDERARHLAAVGLSDASLGEDLRSAGAISAWLGRRGLRLGAAGARSAAHGAVAGAGAARRGAAAVARRVGKVARDGATAIRDRSRRQERTPPPGQRGGQSGPE